MSNEITKIKYDNNKQKTFSHTHTQHTTMRIPHEQPGMNYVRSRIPYRLAVDPPIDLGRT